MKPHPDWIAFKLFTELSLEDMDKLAKQAGFTIHSPFITDEQAARFDAACLEAGIRNHATGHKSLSVLSGKTNS